MKNKYIKNSQAVAYGKIGKKSPCCERGYFGKVNELKKNEHDIFYIKEPRNKINGRWYWIEIYQRWENSEKTTTVFAKWSKRRKAWILPPLNVAISHFWIVTNWN